MLHYFWSADPSYNFNSVALIRKHKVRGQLLVRQQHWTETHNTDYTQWSKFSNMSL